MRCLAIVDGEHYPPVVEGALAALAQDGHEVLAAVLVGGREKLPPDGVKTYGSVTVRTGEDARRELERALIELEPEMVVDLSDEPVLGYRKRHELAAIVLGRGVVYRGADFEFVPPPRPRLATKPSIAIIGTGKRTGKTAVSGFAARSLKERGRRPVIVAMGRGGPPEPEILRGDELELSPERLLEMADEGKHAASDYVEDALLGRVPTVGCRRCGGGLAGGVYVSNVAAGIDKANRIEGDLLILEGSGAAIPPAHADATVLVVPGSIPEEHVVGYWGPFKLLLSDLVVVTMAEHPFVSPSQISTISSHIRNSFRQVREGEDEAELKIVRTVFRPAPTRSVADASVFVATTAPEAAGDPIRAHLEKEHGCRVMGMSHALADRKKLIDELSSIKDRADVLLCEIKAAGIDVATRVALDAGLDVVYMDNVPVAIEGDNDLGATFEEIAALAGKRFGG